MTVSSSRRLGDVLAGSAVVLVHVIVVLASLAGPVLILVDTFFDDGRFSLFAWQNVFGDWPRWATLLSNTAVVCISAVGLCCLAGVVLAIILFKTDVWLRLPAIALLLLSAALPLYAVNGSIGQHDAGNMSGGEYALKGGFLAVTVPGKAAVESSWKDYQ